MISLTPSKMSWRVAMSVSDGAASSSGWSSISRNASQCCTWCAATSKSPSRHSHTPVGGTPIGMLRPPGRRPWKWYASHSTSWYCSTSCAEMSTNWPPTRSRTRERGEDRDRGVGRRDVPVQVRGERHRRRSGRTGAPHAAALRERRQVRGGAARVRTGDAERGDAAHDGVGRRPREGAGRGIESGCRACRRRRDHDDVGARAEAFENRPVGGVVDVEHDAALARLVVAEGEARVGPRCAGTEGPEHGGMDHPRAARPAPRRPRDRTTGACSTSRPASDRSRTRTSRRTSALTGWLPRGRPMRAAPDDAVPGSR